MEGHHPTLYAPHEAFGKTFGICTLPVLGGVPIRIHSMFPLFIVASALFGILNGPLYMAFMLLVDGVILFLTVLIHELGHCWACKYLGGSIQHILLWPLGGLAFLGANVDPKKSVMISIAGPLTHLPLMAFWAILIVVTSNVGFTVEYQEPLSQNFMLNVCVAGFVMQIALLSFNLFVPAYPLDGGRIFACILLMCGMMPEKAAKITAACSVPVAIAVLGVGIWQTISGGSLGAINVFMGLWIFVQAWQLYTTAKAGNAHLHPLFMCYNERSNRGLYDTSLPPAAAEEEEDEESSTQPPKL